MQFEELARSKWALHNFCKAPHPASPMNRPTVAEAVADAVLSPLQLAGARGGEEATTTMTGDEGGNGLGRAGTVGLDGGTVATSIGAAGEEMTSAGGGELMGAGLRSEGLLIGVPGGAGTAGLGGGRSGGGGEGEGEGGGGLGDGEGEGGGSPGGDGEGGLGERGKEENGTLKGKCERGERHDCGVG